MKTKTLFGFVLAALIALFAVNCVIATTTGSLLVSIDEVTANDVEVSNGLNLAGSPGETVPVTVLFTANAALEDIKVKVWVEGYKSDITASTSRFDVVSGSSYIKRLSLTLPNVEEMDDNPEGLVLYVRIYTSEDYKEESYSITMQRESYSVQLLSVEGPSMASAGDVIAYDVVIKNTGARESEDTFVVVSIPELGVSKKTYFGDVQVDDYADDDEEDARERRVYLTLPADVKTGEYTVEIKASNYDTTATTKKVISIKGITQAGNQTTDNDGNVTPADSTNGKAIPTSIIVLTVALVIIFVVLLIVLIVLLTKKPAEKSEDFGETSYY